MVLCPEDFNLSKDIPLHGSAQPTLDNFFGLFKINIKQLCMESYFRVQECVKIGP